MRGGGGSLLCECFARLRRRSSAEKGGFVGRPHCGQQNCIRQLCKRLQEMHHAPPEQANGEAHQAASLAAQPPTSEADDEMIAVPVPKFVESAC